MPNLLIRRRQLLVPRAAAPSHSGLQFDAADDDYASVATHASLETGNINFTLAVRLKLTSTTGANQMAVGKFNAGSASEQEYGIAYKDSADRWMWRVTSASNDIHELVSAEASAPALDTFMVVTAWHDADTNATGIQIDTGTATTGGFGFGVRAANQPFMVGIDENLSWSLDGVVDWVGLWKDRILDSGDIELLVNGGESQEYENLDASLLTDLDFWCDFDSDASPSPDKVGSNDLVWTNTPTTVDF